MKMDQKLVASKQSYEVQHVVDRMREKEGIECTADEVREIIAEVGHSRRKIYKAIKDRKQAEFEAKAKQLK